MNLLKLLVSMIEEHDCSAATNEARNYITFSKKFGGRSLKPKRRRYRNIKSYRLTLREMDADVSRVHIKTKGGKGRPFFIPEEEKLLTVNLHDPRSLEAIQEWLKALQ